MENRVGSSVCIHLRRMKSGSLFLARKYYVVTKGGNGLGLADIERGLRLMLVMPAKKKTPAYMQLGVAIYRQSEMHAIAITISRMRIASEWLGEVRDGARFSVHVVNAHCTASEIGFQFQT